MGDLFVSVLNMSISAAWVLLAVLILRLIFKKAPKRITVLLWCIVGLRLIMPFSVESIFSLIPSNETVSKAWDSPRPNLNSGITLIDNGVNNYLEGHYFEGVTRPAGHFTDITTIAAAAWLIGTAALLIYTAVSFFRLKKGLRTAVLLRDNIFQSEKISSPFVFGIIKPKIYLPFGITERNAESVILHEQAHISRRDYLWKPLGFLLLCVHWFNPLMWLAYVLFCRDIEFACDERAIGLLNTDKRADYSEALLNCSAGRHMLFAYPPAFGEVGVKSRVKSVLNYKKPAFWLAAAAVIVGIAASVCLLTSPKTGSRRSDSLVVRDCIVEDGCEGIGYKLVSSTYEKNNISIRVKWTNKRKEDLYFGEEFKLFKTDGDTACTQKKAAGFDAAANMCTARRAVRSYVTGGSFAASGLRLAALADEFAVESDEESVFYGDGYARLAPVRFADAVSAYGDGVLFAERLDGETCGRAPRIRASECKSAGEYDLIVAGLGAAGSIAAITAARLGLRVFAIERGSQPGGVGTSGGIYTYYLGYGGGIYCEADGLAAKLCENGFARERGCGLLTKGMALDAMLDSCGADVVYGASVCGVLHDTDDTERIDGVIFRTGAGFFAARAPLTIDSTADSAVGLLAGCTMLGGRESDGEFQLFSNVSCFLNRENGCAASENCDDGTVDQYDPADLGIKTLASEAAGPHLGKRYADARYRRLGTVPYLGVREGLRIKGLDTMTLERAASCPTDKAIFFELANLDSHAKDFPFESRGYRDVVELCSLWDCRISIPVTKGCLIPAGVHGLIAAGRNISTDHDIALACRTQVPLIDLHSLQLFSENLLSLLLCHACTFSNVILPILPPRNSSSTVRAQRS